MALALALTATAAHSRHVNTAAGATIYLPMVEKAPSTAAATPTPEPSGPAIEPLPPIIAPAPLYGAVQPSVVIERTGLWYVLVYRVRNTSEPGSYLALTKQEQDGTLQPFQFLQPRLGSGARGSLIVGCDQRLYALINDEQNTRQMLVYRVNRFLGPAVPTVCTQADSSSIEAIVTRLIKSQ